MDVYSATPINVTLTLFVLLSRKNVTKKIGIHGVEPWSMAYKATALTVVLYARVGRGHKEPSPLCFSYMVSLFCLQRKDTATAKALQQSALKP